MLLMAFRDTPSGAVVEVGLVILVCTAKQLVKSLFKFRISSLFHCTFIFMHDSTAGGEESDRSTDLNRH